MALIHAPHIKALYLNEITKSQFRALGENDTLNFLEARLDYYREDEPYPQELYEMIQDNRTLEVLVLDARAIDNKKTHTCSKKKSIFKVCCFKPAITISRANERTL